MLVQLMRSVWSASTPIRLRMGAAPSGSLYKLAFDRLTWFPFMEIRLTG